MHGSENDDFFEEIMHFHYMTFMATPCPGGQEIYNFGRPILGHHYCKLSLFDLCLGVEWRFLKK